MRLSSIFPKPFRADRSQRRYELSAISQALAADGLYSGRTI